MPTWWFWNDPDTMRLATPWLALGSAIGVALSMTIASFSISLLAALAIGIGIGVGTPLVTLGLLERHIRRSVMRRRVVEARCWPLQT